MCRCSMLVVWQILYIQDAFITILSCSKIKQQGGLSKIENLRFCPLMWKYHSSFDLEDGRGQNLQSFLSNDRLFTAISYTVLLLYLKKRIHAGHMTKFATSSLIKISIEDFFQQTYWFFWEILTFFNFVIHLPECSI